MTEPLVTCAGIAVCDVLARTVRHPLPVGYLALVDEVAMAEGGSALRTARAVASMGIGTRLVAAIGPDPFGEFLRSSVSAPDLTVDWVVARSTTSSSVILVGDAGDRTILHNIGADAFLTADAVRAALVGRVLHIGGALVLPGLDGEPLAALFRDARRAGIINSLDVVYDPTGRWNSVLPALAYTDLFCPSRAEAEAITGRAAPEDSSAALRDLGARVVMVTNGADGCYVNSDGWQGHVPAYSVATVDTTGAGDAFAAGAIVGLLAGLPPEQIALTASAMGALATTTIGTFSGTSRPADIWTMTGLSEPLGFRQVQMPANRNETRGGA